MPFLRDASPWQVGDVRDHMERAESSVGGPSKRPFTPTVTPDAVIAPFIDGSPIGAQRSETAGAGGTGTSVGEQAGFNANPMVESKEAA